MIVQYEIVLPRLRRGYHLITSYIERQLTDLPEKGIVNIFLQHTSAAITINENADPTVREDFESFMNNLIPDDNKLYLHSMEGSDDMPAHLKSSILGQMLTIPITNHKLNLGIWQGIYLCEFRNHGSARRLIISVYS
jgi:secondary thiamine-phosphate synthase enzyme